MKNKDTINLFSLNDTFKSFVFLSEIQKIPLPEFRTLLNESLKNLISGEKPYDVEFQIKRPVDNKIIDIHSIAEYDPVTNRVFGTIQDITHMKELERDLRYKNEGLIQFNELFRQFMLNYPIYIFVKEVTPDVSQVIYASEISHYSTKQNSPCRIHDRYYRTSSTTGNIACGKPETSPPHRSYQTMILKSHPSHRQDN